VMESEVIGEEVDMIGCVEKNKNCRWALNRDVLLYIYHAKLCVSLGRYVEYCSISTLDPIKHGHSIANDILPVGSCFWQSRITVSCKHSGESLFQLS